MKPLFRSQTPLARLYLLNFLANFSGNVTMALLNLFSPIEELRSWRGFVFEEGLLLVAGFITVVALAVGAAQHFLQRPVARVLQRQSAGRSPAAGELAAARRRLLHLPFLLAGLNIACWVGVTALLLPVLAAVRRWQLPFELYALFRGCMIAVLAGFIAFFLADAHCRRHLVPALFPEGRLTDTPVRLKMSVLRRIRILFGAGTNAPMLLLVGTIGFGTWQAARRSAEAAAFGRQVLVFAAVVWLIFVVLALSLNFLVGNSILQPVRGMLRLVRRVHAGDYRGRVAVVTNDELGELGDGLNEMTEGLRERERLRRSLVLAREVQQALLPRAAPRVAGLEIAGRSCYCDDTGGDYYDFLVPADGGRERVGIVVGDVSGHGISAALLMASARGYLRQRAALAGGIGQVVTDVNRLLAADAADSGNFMTLFYLQLDTAARRLSWVRAGHEPALLWDPDAGRLEALEGPGPALGVDAGACYRAQHREGLAPGQLVVLGTDGIWEARNAGGEMFGRERFEVLVRRHAAGGARRVVAAVLEALEAFEDGARRQDDVTVVAVSATGA